jgi:DNA ligase (NAD+)
VVLGGLRRAERLAGDPAGLDGLSLVVTGAVEGYSRDGFREALETRGASTAGSVSGRTDLLVVGETPGSAKRRAALEEGVPMVRAAALRELPGPD